MQTVLIASAVTLVIGILSVIMVWNRPRLRKLMFWLIPISLVITVLGWLTTLPAAVLGAYTYISSFASGELGIPALLAKAVACLVVLPLVFGAYLMLRIHSRGWQRWMGVSLILATFAGLFFWGYKHQQEVQAIQQAEAVQVAEEHKIAQAKQARVEEQERLAAIAQEQTKQAAARAVEAQAKTEQQRLVATAAMAEAERVRLELAENARRELAARLEVARRERERQEAQRRQLEEERRRLQEERKPRLYRAPRPVLASEFFQSTPVVSAEQARELARTQNVYVKNFKAESALAVSENLEIRRVIVSWETERNPERVYLIHNGVSAALCGEPPATPVSCGRTGYQEVPRFDSASSQGSWKLKFYGNIGWVQDWKLTIQPVVSANGVVARR